jgi:protein-S-isoprenylcysteine O-methyltransferase Ste14
MLLSDRMTRAGDVFYRWRSFIPLLFLPLVAISLHQAEPIERLAGEALGDAYELACLALVIAGVAVRAYTVGHVARDTSGRKTRNQVAASLNTTGLYSLTRNPLYVGNCMIDLGVVLFTQNLLLGVALALFLVILLRAHHPRRGGVSRRPVRRRL